MKQPTQQVRTKLMTLIMAGMAGAGFSAAATAAGMGGGTSATVGAGATVSAPDTAQAGGAADAHMSTSGIANSNAQWQSEATRGAARAAERMNANGAGMISSGTPLEATGTAAAKSKRTR
jgi:hypothetical protein